MSVFSNYHKQVSNRPDIQIYSKKNGRVVCVNAECQRSPNSAAQTLYESANQIYQFFLSVFKLNGIDGRGKVPPFFIDWDENNAAWACRLSGEECVWQFNNRFAQIPEVACHEWFHAIEHRFANLNHTGQPGALKEAGGDVFAIAFKHWLDPSSEDDWSVGNLRNLEDHHEMQDYDPRADVHENCKIPTHAFYVATLEYGDKTYGVVAKVWFNAFIGLPSNSDFATFALRTFNMAPERARGAILKSWVNVGVFQIPPEKPVTLQYGFQGDPRRFDPLLDEWV